MPKKFSTLVFIGRFQPLHNGHVHVIAEAARQADRVLVLIGSASCARSPKNPFTAEERYGMIRAACEPMISQFDARLMVRHVADHPYNDDAWIAEVQQIIDEACAGEPRDTIGLVGFGKDNSSYYLKMFPGMPSVDVPSQWGSISAAHVRDSYFVPSPIIPEAMLLPETVRSFLKEFYLRPEFKWLLKEAGFYRGYDPTKFPVFITTVDAVVVQSGHVLLIRRRAAPGEGLLALPGGHVNPDETLREAVVRELLEETGISDGRSRSAMPPAVLGSYIRKTRIFDAPDRSLRGRVITEASLFALPQRKKLFEVKGSDDAASATWHRLGALDPTEFFEDHYAILETMTEGAI